MKRETYMVQSKSPNGSGCRFLFVILLLGIGSVQAVGQRAVVVSTLELDIVEGKTTGEYTLVLNEGPKETVTITVTPDSEIDLGNKGGGAITYTFTPEDWEKAQTVKLEVLNDSVAKGLHTALIRHTSSSKEIEYNLLAIPNVAVHITDDDTAGVMITESEGSTNVAEAGTTSDTYMIRLNSQPTETVAITITPDSQVNLGSGTGAAITRTFTTGNWSTNQTITVTAVDDGVPEGPHTSRIVHLATSIDPVYSGISIRDVAAHVTDNDTAGITITEAGASTDVTEGGANDSYTVVLNTPPSASVMVTMMTDGKTTAAPGTLTFTTGNWNTAQTVTVTAVDDAVPEGPHTSTITHTATSTDPNYNGFGIRDVVAHITDNDTAEVTITESSGSTDVTEGGANDSYMVVLNTPPSASVTVTVMPDMLVTIGSEAGVARTITFTPGDWNIPQTVRVTVLDDNIAQGPHHSTITHSVASTDPHYNGYYLRNVVVGILDDDSPGVLIEEYGGSTEVNKRGSTSDSYTLVLSTRPTAAVKVVVDPDRLTDVGAGSGEPKTLSFTRENWNVPQTVIVTAVEDLAAQGPLTSVITHTVTSPDLIYNGFFLRNILVNVTDTDVARSNVIETDNDVTGISLIETEGSTDVDEAGTVIDSYDVVLEKIPTSNVDVVAAPDGKLDLGKGRGANVTLHFTPENWNIPQTVTVMGVPDNLVEGSHDALIRHTIYTNDGTSSWNRVDTLTVHITDSSVQGLTCYTGGVAMIAAFGLLNFLLLGGTSSLIGRKRE